MAHCLCGGFFWFVSDFVWFCGGCCCLFVVVWVVVLFFKISLKVRDKCLKSDCVISSLHSFHQAPHSGILLHVHPDLYPCMIRNKLIPMT